MSGSKKAEKDGFPNTPVSGSVDLILEPELIPRFFGFLRQGVQLEARVGCSIESLLCGQFGLSPEYLDERVQTLFLDGKPVDDVKSTIIKDGSTLALSAAMPGLAGAMLRKGGYYSGMRREISHREKSQSVSARQGTFCLKLFNLLVDEIGPVFLEYGVLVKGSDLEDFFKGQPDKFRDGCRKVIVDDEEVDSIKLSQTKWGHGRVFLQIHSHQSSTRDRWENT